jgi:signal transduction histidine kinase
LEVLPGDHSLLAWARSLDHFEVIQGPALRQSPAWEPGLELGLWGPHGEGLLRILRSRAGGGEVWGLVAAQRQTGAFLPFEVELADLHAGILRVSLENADLITHLDETSRALGNSYEGLESAYESLKSAQRALQVQTQQMALGSLFMTVAKRLQAPVDVLKEESAALAVFMDQGDPRASEGVAECHHAMDRIRQSIMEVDDLVHSVLRRAGQAEPMVPEWLHLHALIQDELAQLQAERILPPTLALEANYEATRDLLFGVHGDFTQMLGHLLTHALAGNPTRLSLRTWGGQGHLRLELEDDGGAIPAELMSVAFEPFLNLRAETPADERVPGPGLPACAQLLQAYGGKIELLPAGPGSLLRLSLPLV